jgi:putative alpha-1,2-mannosidase
MPVLGDTANPLLDHNDTRSATDVTRVGYYKATLGSGTVVEMGATNKAGLYNYTFPNTNTSSNIIVDVSHVLSSYRGQGLGQSYLGGNITVVSSDGSVDHYEGHGSYDNVGFHQLPHTKR